MGETPYGDLERRRFIADALRRLGASTVLDIGCGTGSLLTAPLARELPDVAFLGVDDDAASIKYASQHWRCSNLRFACAVPPDENFDAVIASEVLEHVENPEDFLATLRERLGARGTLLVTVPNGYGPFEWASFIQNALYFSGIYTPLRVAWRILRGKAPTDGGCSSASGPDGQPMTLAVSPHINFFTHGDICKIAEARGFRMTEFRSRVFICGVGCD